MAINVKHDAKPNLYNETVKRLARCGINDPTSQIIALADEIEHYRETIRRLENQSTLCSMIWVAVNHTHVNADNIDCFFWTDGSLFIWYSGDDEAVKYEDPDRKLYRKLCNDLKVKPLEEG